MHKTKTGRWQPDSPPEPPKPENGPFGPDGELRLPGWMNGFPMMPATWPVEYMWMRAGRDAMRAEDAGKSEI